MGTVARDLLVAAALAFATAVMAQPTPPDLADVPKQYPWDHRPRKCFLPGDGPSFDPQCRFSNWPDYATAKGRVDRLFADPDYDLIERAEKELGFSKETFATGEYHFDAWYLSLQANFRHQPHTAGAKVREWASRKGQGGYVRMAEALTLYGEAWQARGSGFSNTVSPEAWKLYHAKLMAADKVLEAASPELRQTGPWHALKLEIAFQHPEQEERRLPLLKAASAAWPEYDKIYLVPMRFAHPRWGGSFEVMDAVARFAMEQTGSRKGAAFYSLLYEQATRGERRYTLRDMNADWNLLKQGFRDVEARGAAQPWIWRNFARLACQIRDKEESRRLYELYDKHRNSAQAAESSDSCRAFAMS